MKIKMKSVKTKSNSPKGGKKVKGGPPFGKDRPMVSPRY
jgi:hypothetical protein